MARFQLAFILVLGMLSCDVQNDQDTEQRRLLNTDRQFAQMSLDQGAAAAFRHYLTSDAMELSPNQHPLLGREAIYQGMLAGGGDYTLSWEPQQARVSASEDMGWTWGKYLLTYLDDQGQEQQRFGKYLNIWERQEDGNWRVVVDMGNSSPAPEK